MYQQHEHCVRLVGDRPGPVYRWKRTRKTGANLIGNRPERASIDDGREELSDNAVGNIVFSRSRASLRLGDENAGGAPQGSFNAFGATETPES